MIVSATSLKCTAVRVWVRLDRCSRNLININPDHLLLRGLERHGVSGGCGGGRVHSIGAENSVTFNIHLYNLNALG